MTGAGAASSPAHQKPRLLVVPHIYAEDISVREIEFARRLVSRFEVFVLKWRDALHVDAASAAMRRLKQFSIAASSALRFSGGVAFRDGFTTVELPVWQPILFHRMLGAARALAFCRSRNRGALKRIIATHGITHVLYASEVFGTERIPNIRAAFDVVDWFPEHEYSPAQVEEVRASHRRIAAQMDTVFAVSEPLCEKLLGESSVAALPLPNGADLARLRSVTAEEVRAVRAKLGVTGKFVIGYIGNHGPFTGVDLAVKAFLAARDRLPGAALLIIGPAKHWQALLDTNRSNGVIATGGVSPAEIGTYFNALDVGVLAQGITTGTDFAFQIKVVEYSACRKIVVSTPLETWKRLAWPNVLLAEANAIAWADAFVRARTMAWQMDWDRFVEPYDWSILANRIADTLLAAPAGK